MEKIWICRFHPTDWWHEVGCPHMQWTAEQLARAAEVRAAGEKLRGTILSENAAVCQNAAGEEFRCEILCGEISLTYENRLIGVAQNDVLASSNLAVSTSSGGVFLVSPAEGGAPGERAILGAPPIDEEARVAQLAEAPSLNLGQRRFDPDRAHQVFAPFADGEASRLQSGGSQFKSAAECQFFGGS